MAATFIRPATLTDLPAMMGIIEEARQLLAVDNIPQWQDGYPNKESIKQDIENEIAYVLVNDQQVAGVAALQTWPDPDYSEIFAGAWQRPDQKHYATIHRIAIAQRYRGQHLAQLFLSNLTSQAWQLGFDQVRIDTHPTNQRMRHLVTKSGFDFAGEVHLKERAVPERLAYQLFLKSEVD
ncbi:MAG: GNAT family N-acetyltransferase [Liquorilactobacillus nagelii]|jgi:ribosomal protein S18 acetylase RimI-like enzyme|uniref:GNAT family N-acetyltransferase n=1 Tax=Liquorilactobacillus nagelii TaxID=82688 RepID=A0A3S6QYE6_9LACO|nr:GNAT family N-acetyltransferase [Liquorilactobacillus nagelii]AUJ33063.1 GNAT family N-acetyltransferase [Liquorilactobacillus nagelii]KRL42058.1 acetyltransferase [Liquorilactobacillus nagelii DSM 13675]MCC7616670.1 N-acetyltransferase [Liquorilactobacillus nagelii]MCP9315305.1 GNAT family N-acetyltransferase [Liquorilactobacillus nagelii]QYH55033.1 GNAT family N-acetyltransferase [Liquorilactobacillus nagelii DSM 13675]